MKLIMIAALAGCLSAVCGQAFAGPCADEIAKLEKSAQSTDAKNSPGSQETPKTADGQNSPAAADASGGGSKSASAKILEAKARDQRQDEPGCMKAVEEAKKLING